MKHVQKKGSGGGQTPARRACISSSSVTAFSQCELLPHAAIAAEYEMTSGRTPRARITSSSATARVGCAPFSHAEIAALYEMTSGVSRPPVRPSLAALIWARN